MSQPLATVQMLWVEGPLSSMERLAVASFLAHGHPVDLYSYGEIPNLPNGVRQRDGRDILPESAVFARPNGIGKGSFAPFSNQFRYQLLYELGGIWCDTDMVCLRPLDFAAERDYFFATERINEPASAMGQAMAASAAFKTPAGSPLMADCLQAACKTDQTRASWGETGPQLLHRKLLEHQLTHHLLQPDVFCSVDHWQFATLLHGPQLISTEAYAIHLWNEKWRHNLFGKDDHYDPLCLYERLKRRYLPAD